MRNPVVLLPFILLCIPLLVSCPNQTSTWARTFGGTEWDEAFAIQTTSDGGYVVAGRTYSFGAGGSDMYLVKLDASGNEEWSKTFGGAHLETAYAVRQTLDGGYVLAGSTNSYGAGGYDFYIVKTDSLGNLIWAKTCGGIADEYAYDILQGTGGYYVFGATTSGNGDMWLAMIDSSGNYLGGSQIGDPNGVESGESIARANDGGFILAGWTTSFGEGGVDAYIVKVYANGEVDWSTTFGDTTTEYAYAIVPRSNAGGYFLAGVTNSETHGEDDMLVAAMNNEGFALWGPVGWTKDDHARAAVATPDNGCAIAGDTASFGAGAKDFCLVKMSSTINIEWQKAFGGTQNDQVEAIALASDGGYVLAGYTESFGNGSRDMYVVKTDENGNAPSIPAN